MQVANLMIRDANRLVANTILLVVHKHGEAGPEGITMNIDFTSRSSRRCAEWRWRRPARSSTR